MRATRSKKRYVTAGKVLVSGAIGNAGGPPMLARMTAAFVNDLNAAHVLHIIERVRAEVGLFYVTTALINLTLGAATATAMLAWGMPTPYLWGALAAMLNFIPYAGSVTTLLVLTLVALKVVAENATNGRALMEFLGPNDQSGERDRKLRRFAKSLE